LDFVLATVVRFEFGWKGRRISAAEKGGVVKQKCLDLNSFRYGFSFCDLKSGTTGEYPGRFTLWGTGIGGEEENHVQYKFRGAQVDFTFLHHLPLISEIEF
jgi:hypothetical protein